MRQLSSGGHKIPLPLRRCVPLAVVLGTTTKRSNADGNVPGDSSLCLGRLAPVSQQPVTGQAGLLVLCWLGWPARCVAGQAGLLVLCRFGLACAMQLLTWTDDRNALLRACMWTSSGSCTRAGGAGLGWTGTRAGWAGLGWTC